MEAAVEAIYRSYPALVMCLECEATIDASAKGLFLEVNQFRFIAFTHLMMDVLPFVGRLSNYLQIDENHMFEGFEDSGSENEEEDVPGFTPELRFHEQQQNLLDRVAPLYVNKIVDNLQSRFQDSSIIDAMKVLVPENIGKCDSVAKFGNDEFLCLVKQYSSHLGSVDDCVSEFSQYKHLVKCSYKNEPFSAVATIFAKKYFEEYPNMVKLLKCVAVLPMSSVKCERGFSTQNRIMSRLRTRLNSKTMDDLMKISEDGSSMELFDFGKALRKWKKEKVRKLYML
ncbi:ZN862-like protein [Mya arenaria]|uniref:ZN862-like protein n=1 Tax=Mya arenaria TaxID=6604 RepID=A0ABY7EPD8_MYAAR|nr:ZN862-like protein [Mya arenaria]